MKNPDSSSAAIIFTIDRNDQEHERVHDRAREDRILEQVRVVSGRRATQKP